MQEYRRRGLQWSQLLCLPVLLSCNMQIFGYTMSICICYVPLRLAFFLPITTRASAIPICELGF